MTVVHGGKLHDHGEVASGAHGDGDLRDLHAHEARRLTAQTETVIGLAVVPGLHHDHKVHIALRLDGAHAEQVLDVDDADAPQLHVISYELGGAADEGMTADTADLHRVRRWPRLMSSSAVSLLPMPLSPMSRMPSP